MENFNICYPELEKYEGGYISNVQGLGESYMFIKRKYYPKWEGWELVDEWKSAFPINYQDKLKTSIELKKSAIDFYKKYYVEYLKELMRDVSFKYDPTILFMVSVYIGKNAVKKAVDRYMRIGDFDQYLILEYVDSTNYLLNSGIIGIDQFRDNIKRALRLHYYLQRKADV